MAYTGRAENVPVILVIVTIREEEEGWGGRDGVLAFRDYTT